jgi:hypothetical protein
LFRVETNIDLKAAHIYHQRLIPDAQQLTPARILIDVFDAGVDLRTAATMNSEIAATPETSALAQLRISQLLDHSSTNNSQLQSFQDFVYDDGRAIRQAVNARHRNFDEVLSVASKAKKIRQWVSEQPDNTDLAKSYLREVSKLDWIDNLPVRSLRWALFNLGPACLEAFGVQVPKLAPVVGSIGDSFLIDKLARGWKPNQFVEGPLREFVEPNDEFRRH